LLSAFTFNSLPYFKPAREADRLGPFTNILETREHNFSELDLIPLQVGPLEIAVINH
jgi:hypothetical protein